MSSTESEQALVSLNVPPNQEEAVVDWLLARPGDCGFSSQSAYGHGANHDNLSQAEQVKGRQRRLQFFIQMPRESVDEFLRECRDLFGATDSHYWVVPILSGGPLEQLEGRP